MGKLEIIAALDAETLHETVETIAAEPLVTALRRRTLQVTPASIVVIPGGRSALRIVSNCAWRVVEFPDDVILSLTEGFGDATVEVSADEDTRIDGRLSFATDDTDVYAEVGIASVAPQPEQPED